MKKAFIFPGQGSQKPGMGKDLYDNFEASRKIFEEANAALGFDLAKICFEGPAEKLNLTEITQPAIVTVSIAAYAAINQRPDAAAGHSLGEYSALVAAGAIEFKDAVKIVHHRGKFMQEAVPVGHGAMAAILGLDRKHVEAALNAAFSKGIVEAANYNSPGQIVISGEKAAVEEAGRLCKEAGAKKIIPLAVSAPFHCSLMKPAADKLALELEKIWIKDPSFPVFSNVTAQAGANAFTIKELLVKQVTGSVLWEDTVRNIVGTGIDTFVEVGCGKVLSGLVKKTAENVTIYNVEDVQSLRIYSPQL